MYRLVASTLAIGILASAILAAPATATTGPGCYRIAGVPAWDVLNVRKRPSARAPIVMALSSNTYAIISGKGACRSGWCPVAVSDEVGTKRGWIKGRYLTPSDCP